ncbi:uncharacterized protein NPIL_671481 [Nephila pilipes]|uniref:Uncharacterized protein n=1 Tax=Nephila pilipes TaxID=299642 RepID=A0A8X6N2T0_NEPPI|nr:uncharacterized protein NPIL_671481 [Nephila pilipes]
MKVLLVVLLCLIPFLGDAYEMRINHTPWWKQDVRSNTVQTSYQFQNFPCHKKNAYGWSMGCKMFKATSWPVKKPTKMSEERWRAMNAREWPEWIPPIRMIKLPLDDPPAPL